MTTTMAIHAFLRDSHVPYSVLPHKRAWTAQAEAAATHVPGRDWAKVVVCFVDGEPIQAVVPATRTVNLARLLELTGGFQVRVAEETEMQRLFPGCEAGAMPPFGGLYGQRVFVDVALAAEPHIFFSAGTHTEVIRMRWSDFAATVRPIVGSFADDGPPDAERLV